MCECVSAKQLKTHTISQDSPILTVLWIEKRLYRVRCVIVCASSSWMTAHSPGRWDCLSREDFVFIVFKSPDLYGECEWYGWWKHSSQDYLLNTITLGRLFHYYFIIYLVIKWCSLLLCVTTLPQPTPSTWVSEYLLSSCCLWCFVTHCIVSGEPSDFPFSDC